VGNPARQVGWMCQCGERLKLERGQGRCARCGSAYDERGGELVAR
jgi:UDP-2-acetamido-3-amino-2,3-dideoxy-glucuronate N-acetyltransferase